MSDRKIHYQPNYPSKKGDILIDVDKTGRLRMSCVLLLDIVKEHEKGKARKDLEKCAEAKQTQGNGPGSGMSNVQGC